MPQYRVKFERLDNAVTYGYLIIEAVDKYEAETLAEDCSNEDIVWDAEPTEYEEGDSGICEVKLV
jgi:hypothetical protein